ncbi:MAG TPA: hypothetical protein VK842_01515 [bacterium]|jgi:hypothetical protein|nr:hypothetical protein [bacterium]
MGFLKQDLATVDVVNGVLPWLVPSEDELRRCDAAAFAAAQPRERVQHEYFLLKAGLGLQYGLGLLESLGMRPEGVEQYELFYVRRLAEGLVEVFPNEKEQAIGLLGSRLKAYDRALHGQHPEDPHLAVADAFTRFCGAADEPTLVTLCLDACKDMHQRFIQEITELGRQAGSPPPGP